ncbi:MAG: UDP-N-acetylglucosamine 2-epimerase (non-hydrolyzing) [Gemmatimonadota bacterium]
MSRLRVLHVVGARPNFMKIAPVMRAFERKGAVEQLLVHTGQHYDDALSRDLFEDLELPKPDMNLGIGSGSHADQTGRTIMGLEPIMIDYDPDWVFTVGDVNSTLAAAIVGAKLGIPIAHVEAGLRSGDFAMPEEINRLVTDRLSSALFTTEPSANENLLSEGVAQDRIHYVGNVMIDTLLRCRERARFLEMPRKLGLFPGKYFAVTLHRPSNVDRADRLAAILSSLVQSAANCNCELVIPFHPRTSARIKEFGLESLVEGVRAVPPLRYLEFLGLMQEAALVLTDSGGIQEETTALGIPCITLRSTTERPVTVTEGTNQLFNGELAELPDVVSEALTRTRDPVFPHLWDGSAAERIADVTVQLGRLSAPDPVTV